MTASSLLPPADWGIIYCIKWLSIPGEPEPTKTARHGFVSGSWLQALVRFNFFLILATKACIKPLVRRKSLVSAYLVVLPLVEALRGLSFILSFIFQLQVSKEPLREELSFTALIHLWLRKEDGLTWWLHLLSFPKKSDNTSLWKYTNEYRLS